MSKPTEGPWYISADDAADCPDHKNSGLAMIDTGRSADWPIARLVEWNNASLLAAAPDLLEACKKLLRFNEELCQDVNVSTHYPSADFARKAIAKAEGER